MVFGPVLGGLLLLTVPPLDERLSVSVASDKVFFPPAPERFVEAFG